MELPSFPQLFHEAGNTFRRFPFVICDAALGTAAAIVLVDHEGPPSPTILFNILLAAALGIPLLTGLALLSERRHQARLTAIGLQIFGILLLVGYAMTVPSDLARAPLVSQYQFYVLAIALHLFVAVVPFLIRNEINGFWHFNRILFLRVLTGLFYSFVLWAGLSIALEALNILFGVSVPGRRYGELWILIVGLFNTWFFAAGIPDNLPQLESMTAYPKGIKVFSQYILFPIVLVYLVILYAYLAKIGFDVSWPEGWVSKLILGFSGTGIFLLLLLYPLRDQPGSTWVVKITKWFHYLLIPLVVVLFLSVLRRVSDYGITEERYFALILGGWLGLMVLYFLLSKTRNIKVIPATLCLVAFVVSIGPWGAFSVARQSQISRLERIAQGAGILVDAKVRPAQAGVSATDAKQISAILSYLHTTHGFGGIQQWFAVDLRIDTIPSGVVYKSPSDVCRLMGFDYVERWGEAPGGWIALRADSAFSTEGYDRLSRLWMFSRTGARTESLGDGIALHVTALMDTMTFTSTRDGSRLLQIDMHRHIVNLLEKYSSSPTGRIPNEAIAVSASGNGLRVRVCPWVIEVNRRHGEAEVQRIDAAILYSVERDH